MDTNFEFNNRLLKQSYEVNRKVKKINIKFLKFMKRVALVYVRLKNYKPAIDDKYTRSDLVYTPSGFIKR